MRKAIAIAGLLVAAALTAAGQEHYVSHWGSHTAPFSTWATAATNLSDAIAVAPNGAVIWVTNGVYRTGTVLAGGRDTRVSITRAIALRSVNGYSNTVIEGAFETNGIPLGDHAVRSVYMTNGVLDGFTLRRGATAALGTESEISGGGVYASGGTLRNMRVAGNYGYTAGGAWLEYCTVSNSIFEMNFAETGPRIMINRQVFLDHCKLNNGGMQFPDIVILGTNDVPLTNGAFEQPGGSGTDFGSVHAGTGTVTHTFAITNQGDRALLISGVRPQGGNTGDWQVVDWPTGSIQPGETAPLQISFTPRETGPRRTLLFVANNDPDDDPYAIWLAGSGIQAEMLVLATNDYSVISNGLVNPLIAQGTDYGDVRISTSDSMSQSYIVTNTGTATLTISAIATSGLNAGDFSVTAPASYPVTIEPGNVATTTVTFIPQFLGYRATLLRVDSDAVNAPYMFAIMGRGVEPEMRVLGLDDLWITNGDTTPDSVDGTDFGLCVSDPIRQRFAITNAGTYALTLTGTPHVVIGGSNPESFIVTAQPDTSMAAGGITEFDIEFSPTIATSLTAEVYIYSDDVYNTNAVYQFRIRGECASTNLFIKTLANISKAGSSAMEWGDFNNDGREDLAILGFDGTNRFTKIYENLGSGNFSDINAGLPGLASGQLAWGDYDNDGWLDLAACGISVTNTLTAIFRNQGDGTFTNINASLTGAYTGGLTWGDYDNDGDLDLFVSGNTLSGMTAKLYRNNGSSVFEDISSGILPVQDGRAVWVDADVDGWLDLLITGDTGVSRSTRLYKNYGGTFTNLALSMLSGATHGGLAIGNLNNDSTPDIAITGYSDSGLSSELYRNSGGTGLYTRVSANLTPLWLGDCKWGDLDNNGWADLIIAGAGAQNARVVTIYTNTSGSLKSMTPNIPGITISSIAMGDSDNDGDLDIAVAGLATNGYFSAIYRNLAPHSNTAPAAPGGLSAALTNGNEVILSWNGATDSETTAGGLSYNLYVGTIGNPVAIMSPHADLTTGKRRISAIGNTQFRRQWRLRNLPPGETIVWGVQAIDSGYAGSEFAAGTQFDVPNMPDFVISDIQIRVVPFMASVEVSNRGTATGNAGLLSVWLNHPSYAPSGASGDLSQVVGSIAPGDSEVIEFTAFTLPTQTVTNTFRAYINSDSAIEEIMLENNQATNRYVHAVYEPFWINAVAITNNVYLRWINPTNIGMSTSQVKLNYSTVTYPANTLDGAEIYQGSAQFYNHTGLTPGLLGYYTIWVTHDGTNWLAPPP